MNEKELIMFVQILHNENVSVYVNETFNDKPLVLSDVHTSLNSVEKDVLGALVLDKYQIERLGAFLTTLEPHIQETADMLVCQDMIKSLNYLSSVVSSLKIEKS